MIKQILASSFIIVIFFLALFLYTKAFGPISFSVNSVNTTKTDTFSVTGEGKSSQKPDIATINLGVQISAPTVKLAQSQLNEKINLVSDGIKKLGIDSKDIQTENYSINPTYNYQSGKQDITGYQANTNLVVKARNLDNVNQIIDSATKNGANQVGGLTFDIDNKQKAESEARTLAVSDAKKKAEQAASIAGFRLGKIVNYQENFNNNPRVMPGIMNALGSADKAPTSIEPGSNEIKVTVTLNYDIL